MHVSVRATFVARIFDVLAWIVLGIGALAALGTLAYGVFGGDGAFFAAIFALIAIVAYTAISWASITLAAVVAGYIAQKSE